MTPAIAPAVPACATARSGLPRLLPPPGGPAASLAEHVARIGPLPDVARTGSLIRTLQAAGLTGRGGAAFPTWRKLEAVAGRPGRRIVVGNGAEGEPASQKDKTLLWLAPHLVVDGLQLAAESVGAADCHLYVHRDPRLQTWLQAVLEERAAAGVDRIAARLADAPQRFLAGEESALASRLDGGPALPRFKPPRVFERGVAGRPTLVLNVETLAHLALIARYGADWFRAAGTAAEPGSMLVTCHLADGTREVTETEVGSPIGTMLRLPDLPAQAVLIGGYHGAWVPGDDALRLRLANADLRAAGATAGAGILAALPGDRCGVAESARVARYLAAESAGQCGPCLNGLPRIAGALAELAGPGPRPEAHANLHRWAGLVVSRGACHHPDGAVRFIRSALTVFAAELDGHARGRCRARTTKPFLPVPASMPAERGDWI